MKKHVLLSMVFIFVSSSYASSQISSCSKSSDIDGRGTQQFFSTDGWIFESWEFKDDYKLTNQARASLKLLNNTLLERGSRLILVPNPFRSIQYPGIDELISTNKINFSKNTYIKSWNGMIEDARSDGIDVVDLLPQIVKFQKSRLGEDFYYSRDHHWTSSGALMAATDVSEDITNLIKKYQIEIQREKNTIKMTEKDELLGSFGEHYLAACGKKTDLMKRFDVEISKQDLSLLGDQKIEVGVFGDSFGQAYPDNNFAEFLENQTQMAVVNYSVSGGGPTLPMLGYFADDKVKSDLPPFVVVPFQGWISNNDFDYNQAAAALIGCDKKRIIDSTESPAAAVDRFTQINKSDGISKKIIHIHTSIPTNYLELRGEYVDGSKLSFEMYRTSAAYFRGSRNDFYAIVPETKDIKFADLKIEDGKVFSMTAQLCYVDRQ